MRGFCGIDIDGARAYVALAAYERGAVRFMEELEIALNSGVDYIDTFKKNAHLIEQRIQEKETAYSLKVEKVFCTLPWGVESRKQIDETVPFKSRKKISVGDIGYARNYIEEMVLDWDDACLHHVILDYEIEGQHFIRPPIGVQAKKIHTHSLLFYVKEKIRRDMEDIFDNLDREFGGFVSAGVSSLAVFASVPEVSVPVIILGVGYNETYASIYREGSLEFLNDLTFSMQNIFQEIENKFLLAPGLAGEIASRYLSFKETPHYKEISVKNGDAYTSLSTQTFNAFVCEYVGVGLRGIVERIKAQLQITTCAIGCVSQLTTHEGFSEFFTTRVVAGPVLAPVAGRTASLSFGCLRYGVNRFLENDYRVRSSLMQKIMHVYSEYF